MAKQILILCKSPREANQYAKLVGLQRFTYRYVARAGTIHGGLRQAEVHVLPSFLARIDRHRILSALRWTKCEVFYCDPADFEEQPEQEQPKVEWRDPAPLPTGEARAELEANVQAALNANPDDFAANVADAFLVADEKTTGTINDDGTVTFKLITPGDPADFEEPREQEATEADLGPEQPSAERRAEVEKELEGVLEPEGWEPPAELSAEQVLALAANPDKLGSEVLSDLEQPADEAVELDPIDDPEINPDGRKRRYTCKVCDQKVFSDADPAHDQDAHATTEALKHQDPESASGFFG